MMLEKEIIPVDAIYERDIDLLLLEEFTVNQQFRDWFLTRNQLPAEVKFNGAWRSVSGFNLGETDVLVSYESAEGTVYLLIENKLDAIFQEEQYYRYIERAKRYQQQGECNHCFVLLIAPEQYLETHSDFDCTESYEAIMAWMQAQGSSRLLFKSRILEIAVKKLRRGYRAVNDPVTQAFWLRYWETLKEISQLLDMKKPESVPLGSDWPALTNKTIKKHGFQIYHKLSMGCIDAQHGNEYIKTRLQEINLPEGFSLVKTGKSLSVRVNVPIIDKQQPFSGQVDKVREAILSADHLCRWLLEQEAYWK